MPIVIRLVANICLSLLANALGLIVAALVLDDMSLSGAAFVIAVVLFTVALALLQPLVIKMSFKYAPALRGSSALVATLLALIVTAIVSDGLHIRGFVTWILATVIVWVISLIGALVLPMLIFKKVLAEQRGNNARRGNPGASWP
jgi:uncharacterized membrane protein YvlD (DUF360 family)